MQPLPPRDLGHGICLIDTLQERPGMAGCYLLEREGELAFIETGTAHSTPRLLDLLAARGLAREQVRYVIPTHVHLDHAGGAGSLMAALPRATLVVHPRGQRHLVDPSRLLAGARAVYGEAALLRMYGAVQPVPAERTLAGEDGLRLPLGRGTLEIIDSPGHAHHHLSVWDERAEGFFTGDTFGLSYREFDGPGGPWILPTTTPVQFDPQAWSRTLERYRARRPQRMFLTHFGEVGAVARLADQLEAGLARYVALAQALRPAPERHLRLRDALLDDARADLRSQGCTLAEAEMASLLMHDLELNAQGLGHWLDHGGH
ncbi:MAG TPA: MBL fold metallo-hydrolase [Nevskiaceae bacterium]|nr:MBL fold metallo-hydrolase [Nevskiaceae bacterium]